MTIRKNIFYFIAGMCSFEASDICGYKQDHDTDKFDWVRSNGPTSSIGTGPVADHTYGTVYGKCAMTRWLCRLSSLLNVLAGK